MKKKENGFIKEILLVSIAILILAYFNIDIQEAATWIKLVFNWIINLFNI